MSRQRRRGHWASPKPPPYWPICGYLFGSGWARHDRASSPDDMRLAASSCRTAIVQMARRGPCRIMPARGATGLLPARAWSQATLGATPRHASTSWHAAVTNSLPLDRSEEESQEVRSGGGDTAFLCTCAAILPKTYAFACGAAARTGHNASAPPSQKSFQRAILRMPAWTPA